MNIRFHTKTSIKQWVDDLARIPNDIAAFEREIKTKQEENRQIDQAISDLITQIEPYDTKIAALEAQITFLRNNERIPELQAEIKSDRKEHEDKMQKLSAARETKLSIERTIYYKESLKNIQAAQQVVNDLPARIREQEMTVSSCSNSLRSEQATQNSLTSRISVLNREISSLQIQQMTDHHHDHYHGHHGHHDNHHNQSLLTIVAEGFHHGSDIIRDSNLASCRSELSQKERELCSCSDRISRYSSQILTANQAINTLRSQLFSSQSIINSASSADIQAANNTTSYTLTQELSNLNYQQQQESSNINTLERQTSNLKNSFRKNERTVEELNEDNIALTKQAGDNATNSDMADLKSQLSQTKEAKKPYSTKKEGLSEKYQSLVREIEAAQGEIASLNRKNNNLYVQTFLIQLRDEPATLQKNLITAYDKAITQFKGEHPDDQSENEQLRLSEMRKDMEFIATHPIDNGREEGQPGDEKGIQSDGLPENDDRTRLYESCGMLIAKHKLLSAHDEPESDLADKLYTILNRFPLDGEADYLALQRPLVNQDALIQESVDEYDNAVAALSNGAREYRDDNEPCKKLAETAIKLVEAIEANKNNHLFNVTYYTLLIKSAKAVLDKPTDVTAQQNFAKLKAKDPIGQSNNCSRVTGAVFLFAGAATAVCTYFNNKIFNEELPDNAKYVGYGAGGLGMLFGIYKIVKGGAGGSVKAANNMFEAAKKVPTMFSIPKQRKTDEVREHLIPIMGSINSDGGTMPSAPVYSSMSTKM